ncbi:MAG: UPF0280 family protein [Candidatus Aminicenantes bacterium]|nr:UPF0280 family protein [Candidatus Aminicenantes bacterium]
MDRIVIRHKDTVAAVVAEKKYFTAAETAIQDQRRLLEEYIEKDPAFRTALHPHPVPDDAPRIVRRMAEAASRAGVGPMAAVAGATAEAALRAMAEAGATHALVDNGGDIALLLDRPVIVGIFTGPSSIREIGFRVEPRPGIFGICTSSGTVGHSLSFGKADSATVISADVALADAVATALGNALNMETEARLQAALAEYGKLPGVEGLLAVIGKLMAVWGDLPPLVRTKVERKGHES